VGESGQPRVVVADDGDFTWHVDAGRPLPGSPRTVHPQHPAERQRQQLIGGAGVAVGQRTSRAGAVGHQGSPGPAHLTPMPQMMFVWRCDIALPESALEGPTRQLTPKNHLGRGTHNRSICRASATSFVDRHRAQSRRSAH
jgi:hypothetical protein